MTVALLNPEAFNPYIHVLDEPRNTGPTDHIPDSVFDPHSPVRRYAEIATGLMVPYIAGLAVCRDSIAAGVAEHSHYTEHPYSRVYGTGQAAADLTFADKPTFHAQSSRLFGFHERKIQGVYQGVYYDANNGPDQAWVWVSTHQGIIAANQRWGKADSEDNAALWEDIYNIAVSFGTPTEVLPKDLAERNEYYEAMIEGPFLLQTPVSIAQAQRAFRFESPKVPSLVAHVSQAISIASLDPRLRERAGLRLEPRDERINHAVDVIMRQTYSRLSDQRREAIIPAIMRIRPGLMAGVKVVRKIHDNLEKSKTVART